MPLFLALAPWDDPSLFSQQIISGIASGSLFAILALAIVMIYRSTSVLNFAQGELAMFTTFISWSFMTRMDFWPAFLLAVLLFAIALMLTMPGESFNKFKQERDKWMHIIAALGVVIIFLSAFLRLSFPGMTE